jgi:hypothetical protein
VGKHHQGDDRDDGRLDEGSADRQEPHFAFCFFIHRRQRAAAWIVPGIPDDLVSLGGWVGSVTPAGGFGSIDANGSFDVLNSFALALAERCQTDSDRHRCFS